MPLDHVFPPKYRKETSSMEKAFVCDKSLQGSQSRTVAGQPPGRTPLTGGSAEAGQPGRTPPDLALHAGVKSASIKACLCTVLLVNTGRRRGCGYDCRHLVCCDPRPPRPASTATWPGKTVALVQPTQRWLPRSGQANRHRPTLMGQLRPARTVVAPIASGSLSCRVMSQVLVGFDKPARRLWESGRTGCSNHSGSWLGDFRAGSGVRFDALKPGPDMPHHQPFFRHLVIEGSPDGHVPAGDDL